MGTIYQAIISEHSECGYREDPGSKNFTCVAVTPDDELICTQCGETIKL